jgi:molecular chaperone GrpE
MSENQEHHVQQTQETNAQQEPDLAARLAEAESQLAQYKDLLLRKAAEFENYKKRVENESAAIVKFATQELIVELLPILDDLERSLKLSKDRKDFESFYKGVELIYQKMVKVLADQGVKAMDTVGKEFNVEFHDALMQVPRDDVPPHTILEEVEKGYTLHDKVIRHAKVIVSAVPLLEASTENAETAAPSDDHQDSRT